MATSTPYTPGDGPDKVAYTKKERRDMAEWWGPVAAGAGFAGAVGGFGYFMDGRLDDAFRAKVRDKLTRVPPEGDATGDDDWPTLFLTMFDRLFDPKGNGRPRFGRSAAASMLVLTALFVAWVVLVPERAEEAITFENLGYVVTIALGIALFVVLPINIVGDFFSLWESRFVIGRMAVAPGTIRIAAFLLLDLIATVIIFVAALAVGTFWIVLFFGLAGNLGFAEILEIAIRERIFFSRLIDLTTGGGLLFSHEIWFVHLLALVAYTTLFTSVWVWLFMLGGVLWPLFNWLRGVLGVDKFPVGSAMAIGGLFGGLVVTALGYVRMAALS